MDRKGTSVAPAAVLEGYSPAAPRKESSVPDSGLLSVGLTASAMWCQPTFPVHLHPPRPLHLSLPFHDPTTHLVMSQAPPVTPASHPHGDLASPDTLLIGQGSAQEHRLTETFLESSPLQPEFISPPRMSMKSAFLFTPPPTALFGGHNCPPMCHKLHERRGTQHGQPCCTAGVQPVSESLWF